jgi:homoprotocatechuate degradation regulator HpaR
MAMAHAPMTNFERSLPMMLYRALDAVLPAFRMICSEYGLTEQQWRILRSLWAGDGLTVSSLAQATLVAPPSLVGILDRMERDGLVVRLRSSTDRRVVTVSLTATGRSLQGKVQPRIDAIYHEMANALTETEWQSLYQSMDKLVAWASDRENHNMSAAQPRKSA